MPSASPCASAARRSRAPRPSPRPCRSCGCGRGRRRTTARRAHPGEGLADRAHVALQRALDQPEQVVGRPPVERVGAELPGEVLVVGAHPAGHREDHVEQPRHRLGCVEARLERAAVAVVLQGAVGEVEPAVEPVVVDQHAVGLLGRQRRLAADGVGQRAARAVEEHGRPGVGPALPPVLGAEGRDVLQLGPGVHRLVDLGGLGGRATGGGLVGQHDDDVEVGALGGEVAGRRAAQHEPEQVVAVRRLVALGEATTIVVRWAGVSHPGRTRSALTWAATSGRRRRRGRPTAASCVVVGERLGGHQQPPGHRPPAHLHRRHRRRRRPTPRRRPGRPAP